MKVLLSVAAGLFLMNHSSFAQTTAPVLPLTDASEVTQIMCTTTTEELDGAVHAEAYEQTRYSLFTDKSPNKTVEQSIVVTKDEYSFRTITRSNTSGVDTQVTIDSTQWKQGEDKKWHFQGINHSESKERAENGKTLVTATYQYGDDEIEARYEHVTVAKSAKESIETRTLLNPEKVKSEITVCDFVKQ